MSSEAMREAKDPVIKLFGKLIPLPKSDFPSNLHTEPDAGSQIPVISDLKDFCGGMKKIEAKDDDVEDCGNQEKSSVSEDDKQNQTHNNKNKDEPQVGSKMEDNTGITDTSEEKVPKKTDKILPCPRCTSLETKFCYFNNYNVNQPRHFCRNCQRYWTDGGTMRKVAVGAGRRKNKQLGTHYCQLLVPRVTIQSTTDKNPEIVDQHVISHDESLETSKTSAGNEKLLKFDFKKPLRESLGALSPRDRITCADIGSIGEIKEEQSQCVSSLTSVHDDEILEKSFRDKQGGLSGFRKTLIPRKPLPCFTTPKWNSTWNACWNSTSPLRATPPVVAAQFNSEPTRDSNDTKSDQINWCSSPVMAVHGLCPPTIQFVPVPYWGLSCWPVTTSNIPLAKSGTNYQTTGKHSRDEVSIEAETSKKHDIVPKMLRVDPDEASKSRKH